MFSGVCTLVVGILGLLATYLSKSAHDLPVTSLPRPLLSAIPKMDLQDSPPAMRMEESPSPGLTLSIRSVLLLHPVAIASTDKNRAFTEAFRPHIEDRIKAAFLRTGTMEIVNRQDLEPIDRELQYIEETSFINGRPGVTAEAYRIAASHGARWMLAPFVSVEPEHYSQDALGGPTMSSVTVRITIYVCDLMSRAWVSPPFEATKKSTPEYAPKTDPPVRGSLVRSLIDSVSEKVFATKEFQKWTKDIRDK